MVMLAMIGKGGKSKRIMRSGVRSEISDNFSLFFFSGVISWETMLHFRVDDASC